MIKTGENSSNTKTSDAFYSQYLTRNLKTSQEKRNLRTLEDAGVKKGGFADFLNERLRFQYQLNKMGIKYRHLYDTTNTCLFIAPLFRTWSSIMVFF